MKKLLMMVAASCLLQFGVHANDIEPSKEFYTAIKAVNPIVLDGDLSEWTGAALLADPRFYVPKGSGSDDQVDGELVFFEEYNGGTWTGPDDHTSAVQVVYDDDNVYFGFVVTDEYHENSANSAWNGDSVQLMIANDARDTQIALYNYALGGVEGDIGEIIVMHEAGPGGTEAVIVRNAETGRTTYEIKLPKEALEIAELVGGVQFGLGMAINDGDEDTPGQKGWGGLGAHSIVFGKSPEETALVTLAAPVEQNNDIEPGKDFYTAIKAANPIVLDGDLSEWKGAALLADPRFSIPKGSKGDGELVFFEEYNGGTWTGPDDHTSAVQVVYDDDNVYFGFIVTDEYHENSANSAWNGDSVQLMITNDARDTQIALYNYALGGVEGDIGEIIVMHEAGPGGTEAVIVRNAETGRTTYEIKLPKEALEISELKGGVQFGLGMAINDGDEDTPGQKGWGGLGAHSIVFGKSPEETALITLATSNDIEPGKESYTANPSPGNITVDGDLSDWGGIPVLSDPRFAIPKGSGRDGELVLFEEYNGGNWTGPDDHTSAVQIIYDQDNVYFGFVVTDDYHENSANSAWNGDSVQLMIANDKQDTQIALYNYALGGIETELGEIIIMHEAGPGGTEAVVVRNTETKRTIYEIKMPKEALGLTSLKLGTQFGLGMAINDGDEDTPGQKGWGGLGAHSIVFGKSPEHTALITLGVGGTSGDVIFLSAINPALDKFTFRATDKGDSIVDPTTGVLTIDGVDFPLEASPKKFDATDFTHRYARLFLPNTEHTYTVTLQDMNGKTVTDSSTFVTGNYGILSDGMQAVDVDTSQPGFLWRIFQNDFGFINNLEAAERALATGEVEDEFGTIFVAENLAWKLEPFGPANGAPTVLGSTPESLVQFEIPGVINVSYLPFNGNGNYPDDEQMPGIPGFNGGIEGAVGEVITFIDFPAGFHTLGVNNAEGFRAQAALFENESAEYRILLGESETPTETTFLIEVKEAGIYPVRFMWYINIGEPHMELFSIKEDGSIVLLNDTANGGLQTYRAGSIPADRPDDVIVEPMISLSMDGDGNIVIDFAGSLMFSPTVDGDYSAAPGIVSPLVINPSTAATARGFYKTSN